MKKMMLISPEQYTAAAAPVQEISPERKKINALDEIIREILNREDIVDDEKVKLYQAALNKSIQFREPSAAPVVLTTRTTLEDIVSSVPKAYKNKAQLLAKTILRELSWTDRNELISNGQPVHGSNILDLVNDVIRKRKYFNPEGREEFADALRQLNIPQDLVGNSEILDKLRQRQPKRQPSPSPPPPSPRQTRRRRRPIPDWLTLDST